MPPARVQSLVRGGDLLNLVWLRLRWATESTPGLWQGGYEAKGPLHRQLWPQQEQGQAIDFIATDLLKVTNGLITDDWHIEDNLTLLSQMGVAKVER